MVHSKKGISHTSQVFCISTEQGMFRLAGLIVDANTLVAFVLALGAGIGLGVVGLVVSRVVAPSKFEVVKNERFECGNPPSKEGRGKFSMQYFAYLVVFLTVEPIFIYSFLPLMGAHDAFLNVLSLFGVILLMLIPPMIFGLDSARKIDLWTMKEESQS